MFACFHDVKRGAAYAHGVPVGPDTHRRQAAQALPLWHA